MLCLTRPSPAAIDDELARCAELAYSYPAVGASAAEPPPGYRVDRHRTDLGRGDAVFRAAVAAFRQWRMFDLGWVSLCWPETPIEAGQVVGALARSAGLWWLNPCRIVYVVDEPRRFGFAYGTLPSHAESGEERFLIAADEEALVTYSVLAFSRPGHPLSRLAAPWTRRMQRRFAGDSMARMRRAVAERAP